MNILLVYTKTLSVERLKALLKNDHPDYEVAACSGLDVLKVTSEFKPHIAIIETGSHAPDSPAIMRYLKKQNGSVYLIAIAGAADEAAVQEALAAGAVDLIFGTPSDSELLYRIGKAAVPAAVKARPVPLRRPAKRKAAGRSRSKPPQKGGRAGKVLGNITFGILLTMMALLALFLIQSKITGEAPSVFGYRIYVVLSGSMNPAFDTGSAVFVQPVNPETIEVGDIVTFSSREEGMLTTHRVVAIDHSEGLNFTTRGDANNVDDPNPVPGENIIGCVRAAVPYMGYIMGFARSRQGLIMLVFIPSFLVIIFELRNIVQFVKEGVKEIAV